MKFFRHLTPFFALLSVHVFAASTTDADLDALFGDVPFWITTGSLRSSAGYNSNVALTTSATSSNSAPISASRRPQSSEFGRIEGDFLISHPQINITDYYLYTDVTETHFFRGSKVRNEQDAFASAQIRVRPDEIIALALDAKYYFQNQVFDLATTDFAQSPTLLKVNGATVGPSLRLDLSTKTWFELDTTLLGRERYHDHVYDNREQSVHARLGRKIAEASSIKADFRFTHRKYDTRPGVSAQGFTIRNTFLQTDQPEATINLDIAWDSQKHFHTISSAGYARFQDQNAGYFDYHLREFSQEITWNRGPWDVSLKGDYNRYSYKLQTVVVNRKTYLRKKEQYTSSLKVTRTLSERFAAFFQYDWEDSRSNDVFIAYHVNVAFVGIEWKFH